MPDFRSTKVIVTVCIALWCVIVVRAAMNTKGTDAFVKTVPQSEIQAFAREQLGKLQQRSFAEDQEYCAVIFEDSHGKLGTTRLVTGEKASCGIAYFDEPGMAPVASFHTHAAFDRDYDSEVPSLLDMQSDIGSGMDGYVSTPGGRFWRIDATNQIAELVCGAGCLDVDPDYIACEAFSPKERYSVAELEARARLDTGKC